MARPLLTLLLALLLGGCQLWTLDRQVKMAQRSMVLIPGQLQTTAAQPALVALYAEGNLLAYRSVRPGGFFYFSMAAGGYSLLAFEDRNGNLGQDPHEPRHWQGRARTAPGAASISSMPLFRLSRANSAIRIAFLLVSPTVVSMAT